ncbi:hypothetical protein KESI111651_04170 [Kerstersia similis]
MDWIFFSLGAVTAGLFGFVAGAIFGVTRPQNEKHD